MDGSFDQFAPFAFKVGIPFASSHRGDQVWSPRAVPSAAVQAVSVPEPKKLQSVFTTEPQSRDNRSFFAQDDERTAKAANGKG